ncbi:hypothetical protein [Streptomyces sp. NPDC048442]|uniref:hypothetical protein n=1 Tax=Streptomyces sp. NPDC048442 TaxID=3154823 RepID=UPI0034314728
MQEHLFPLYPPHLEGIQVLESLHGRALGAELASAIGVVAEASGQTKDLVHTQIQSTVCGNSKQVDDHDRREAVRVLRVWLKDPQLLERAHKESRPRRKRPDGTGQLPVPRITKSAVAETECGLCADPIKAGELIGRPKMPKSREYVPMGWLCGHCLYERRQTPRRRDVLLRIFHHLFASSAVDLNAPECTVLHLWLSEEPSLLFSQESDSLELTLTRMATSAAEDKPATWISFPTAEAIVAVLASTPRSTQGPDERVLLDAVLRHLEEWRTNAQRLSASRFGTGPRYRREVLRTTEHPSVLSVRGGPFDLHTAPAARSEEPAVSSASPAG